MAKYEIYVTSTQHLAFGIIDTLARVLDVDPNIFSILDYIDGKHAIFSSKIHTPIRKKAMKYIAAGFEAGYDFAVKE